MTWVVPARVRDRQPAHAVEAHVVQGRVRRRKGGGLEDLRVRRKRRTRDGIGDGRGKTPHVLDIRRTHDEKVPGRVHPHRPVDIVQMPVWDDSPALVGEDSRIGDARAVEVSGLVRHQHLHRRVGRGVHLVTLDLPVFRLP